jgi:hypothetical protein
MTTRTAAPRRPTPEPAKRKAAAGSAAAAKKAGTKAVAAPASRPARLSAADIASLRELTARLGEIDVRGLAGRFVQAWRADLDEIVQTNRKSYSGLQAVARRQIEDAAGELATVGKVMASFGAKESVRHLNGLALASLQLALADLRELAVLAANAQRETFQVVHGRATRTVEQVQQLLRKRTPAARTPAAPRRPGPAARG